MAARRRPSTANSRSQERRSTLSLGSWPAMIGARPFSGFRNPFDLGSGRQCKPASRPIARLARQCQCGGRERSPVGVLHERNRRVGVLVQIYEHGSRGVLRGSWHPQPAVLWHRPLRPDVLGSRLRGLGVRGEGSGVARRHHQVLLKGSSCRRVALRSGRCTAPSSRSYDPAR